MRRIARGVGMRPRSGQTALVDDEVLLTDRLVGKEALEDLARPRRQSGQRVPN